MDIEEMVAGLNGPQREAVREFDHPLLVLAGAGSGKTRVITTKIAYAIRKLGIPSYKILAVTFTNKAAGEMSERVRKMVGDFPDDCHACIHTFHGFGAMLLRRYSDRVGLSPRFSIYDDDDSFELLKKVFPGQDVKTLRQQSRKISLLKDKGVTPQMVRSQGNIPLATLYEGYQKGLDATGNVDFADLILKATKALSFPEVADWAHNRFKVILVDEYQDTNACQFAFLKKVAGPDSFVCVVGDDDQSIYRFRGAEEGNIDAFKHAWKDMREIKLEQNYRSTPSILNLANSVIRHNHGEGGLKKLWTENQDLQKPQLFYVENEIEEAELVASLIKASGKYNSTAVLFRTNAQSGPFETAFTKPEFRIPYKVIGALRFYDREQVKDALAMMYLLSNPKDIVSFRRMVNKPARGIGPTSQARIEAAIEVLGGDCLAALASCGLTGKAKEGADSFLGVLKESSNMIREHKLTEALNHLLRDSHLYGYYADVDRKEGKTQQEGSRVADFDTLISQAAQYGDDFQALSDFLETLALDPTTIGTLDPSAKEGVSLITMHNTKGLEFDNVFVVGLEEGLFPSIMSMDEDPLCREERRLFYVSVTRARKSLVLTSAKRRMRYGMSNYCEPSRFLEEIAPALVDVKKRQTHPCLGEDSFSWHRGDSLYKKGVSGGWRGMDLLQEKRTRRMGAAGPSALLHQGFGSQVKKKEEEEKERKGSSFRLGERVLSGSYGPGFVQQVKDSGAHEVIVVRFDSGKVATFLSRYAKLEKISD